MAVLKAELSQKDKKFREMSLNGDMWRVVFYMCIPLGVYQLATQLFRVLDTMMAAHISTASISAVTYLSQITMMLSAVGGGLAVGAGIKISEAYGAGDYRLVRSRVSSLYAIIGIISVVVLAGILPFTDKFLILAGTPTELISQGRNYFIIDLIATVVGCFNNVYLAVERTRGNSKRILIINMAVIIVKFALTAFFIYGMNGNINHIAGATLIAQLLMFVIAMFNMYSKDNAFGFSLKAVSFRKDISGPMAKLSVPVMSEKLAFSFGKVIINIMSKDYGTNTVGALGVSNMIGGATTSTQNGFQEGGASIISQNLGAKKYDRAVDAFKKLLIINVIIGTFGFIITTVFLEGISSVFSKNDESFRVLVTHIYRYEAFGAITLGINASVMALLYGMGLTKLTLILNVCRVFVFRVPVLWFLQKFTDIGSDSVGIVMMVSNVSVGIVAGITAIIVLKRFRSYVKFQ